MKEENIASVLAFLKRLVNEFRRSKFIPQYLILEIKHENGITWKIRKKPEWIPYHNFFDIIRYSSAEKKVHIIEYTYSVKDFILENDLNPRIKKQMDQLGFWKKDENILMLRKECSEAFDIHDTKETVINKLKYRYRDIEVQNVIDDNGYSLIDIEIKETDEKTLIERILNSLQLLKEIYKEIFSLEEDHFTDDNTRERDYYDIIRLMNISQELVTQIPNEEKYIKCLYAL